MDGDDDVLFEESLTPYEVEARKRAKGLVAVLIRLPQTTLLTLYSQPPRQATWLSCWMPTRKTRRGQLLRLHAAAMMRKGAPTASGATRCTPAPTDARVERRQLACDMQRRVFSRREHLLTVPDVGFDRHVGNGTKLAVTAGALDSRPKWNSADGPFS